MKFLVDAQSESSPGSQLGVKMIDWLTARRLIAENVRVGTDLNTPASTHRVVRDVHEDGFVVPIGEETEIVVPWSMLEFCWSHLITSEGYRKSSFVQKYAKEARDHGCHVHVVGRIFLVAGLAEADGSRRYVSTTNAIR